MALALTQPPYQITVDRAKAQLAICRRLSRPFDIVGKGQLGAAEVRINDQTRGLANDINPSTIRWVRSPWLSTVPHRDDLANHGIVNTVAGSPIPKQRGFSLISDAYGCYVAGR